MLCMHINGDILMQEILTCTSDVEIFNKFQIHTNIKLQNHNNMKRNERGNIGTDQAHLNPLQEHLDKLDAQVQEETSVDEAAAEKEASREAFKRMQRMAGVRMTATPESAVTMTGWFDVDMSQLGYGGRLYPQDLKIVYRAARAAEIRHWSNMDDSNLNAQVAQHLTDLIAVCCRCVSISGNNQYSYKDIYEHDKWKLIMMIHDLTFPENSEVTNPILLDVTSGVCKHHFKLNLSADNIHFVEPDSMLDKYIDSENGGYLVNTKSLGQIALKPSTIGVGEAMAQYMMKLDIETQRNIIGIAPVVAMQLGDWRGLNDKLILQAFQEFNGIEPLKALPLLLDIADKATVKAAETIKFVCPHCKMEGEAPFRFPNGIKQIFRPISNIESELL